MLAPDDPRHGIYTTYSKGLCRSCDACKAAWNAYKREYYDEHPEQREKAKVRSVARRARLRAQMVEVPNAIIVEL